MKIRTLTTHLYSIPLTTGVERKGFLLCVVDEIGNKSWGEVAPLPQWSKETLDEVLQQLLLKRESLLKIEWEETTLLNQLEDLELFPSLLFGLECALLHLIAPLPPAHIKVSALLMGSPEEILSQAALRKKEGFICAKVKFRHLSLKEAHEIVGKLMQDFALRIDLNRSWKKEEVFSFFSHYHYDAFEYVEDPLPNPEDLTDFTHPFAVDEFLRDFFTLDQLAALPNLKALIYKPMLQGGLTKAVPLAAWAKKNNISFILSSSFESDLGLVQVASLAPRLGIEANHVGIGTYHYLQKHLLATPLHFRPTLTLPARLSPLAKNGELEEYFSIK